MSDNYRSENAVKGDTGIHHTHQVELLELSAISSINAQALKPMFVIGLFN